MGLRFQSALTVDCLPDPAIDNSWEVIMPKLNIMNYGANNIDAGFLSKFATAAGLGSYQPIVEGISFGTLKFKTDTRRIRTGWVNIPSDIDNWDEVNITMYVSAGMLTQAYLAAWRGLVFNRDGEYYNSMCNYKRNIEVYFYGPGNIGTVLPAAMHFTIVGAFPTVQDQYKLDYKDSPKRITINQRFKCDKVVYNQMNVNSSIITETATNPYSLVDKAITGIMQQDYSVSNYDIEKTYR